MADLCRHQRREHRQSPRGANFELFDREVALRCGSGRRRPLRDFNFLLRNSSTRSLVRDFTDHNSLLLLPDHQSLVLRVAAHAAAGFPGSADHHFVRDKLVRGLVPGQPDDSAGAIFQNLNAR